MNRPCCTRCGCFCAAARDPSGMTLCPHYYALRDTLFPGGCEVSADEDRMLCWLASWGSQPALIALFKHALSLAAAPGIDGAKPDDDDERP